MVFYIEGTRGTIQPHPECDSEEACIKLNDSMVGIGTDEEALTNVILAHSFKQRQDIKKRYQEIYDRDLLRQIESEISFSYEQIVMALMSEPQEFILECINEAVTLHFGEAIMKKFRKATYRKGIADDEFTLMGLLIPRSNRDVDEIKKAYRKKYKKHLEKKIATSDNLSLDFRRLIIAMIDCKREESGRVDGDQIFKDCMKLVGSKKEEAFHVVMHERSWLHLRQLFKGYKDLTGKPIEDMVQNSSYSLDLKESYLALLLLIRSPVEFFAERLHDAIEGAGTDDDTLIQVMVLRSEIDLVDISREYERKYGVTLAEDISGDTSGDYEDILLKMLKVPNSILIAEAKAREAEEGKGDGEENAAEEGEETAAATEVTEGEGQPEESVEEEENAGD